MARTSRRLPNVCNDWGPVRCSSCVRSRRSLGASEAAPRASTCAARWRRGNLLFAASSAGRVALDTGKRGEASLAGRLFGGAREGLPSEPLLPRSDARHVSAADATRARTQELRALFDPTQLAALFGHA